MDDLKSRLLGGKLPEADVEIPGVGTVRVRGLTRAEQLLTVKQADIDREGMPQMTRVAAIERRMIAVGLLDPVLTEAEIDHWQNTSPAGDVSLVANKISELSGMMPGQAKDATKSDADGAGETLRVLPGGEAEDAGSPAT